MRWLAVVAALAAPACLVLSWILWHTPYPLSEGVALLEDVDDPSSFRFLDPSTAYYRPLFHLSLFGAWHLAPSLDGFLALVRLFHIVPAVGLIALLLVHLRPARLIDAAAASVAVAVLMGSPGFLDNVEIPLTYTIVGMLCALMVWLVMERDHAAWHGPAIVALTLIAIGFKEQGLVIVPVVVVAWWMGAPGVRRATAAAVIAIAVAYVGIRLGRSARWAPFEQDIGLWFTLVPAREAVDRFGTFPYWMYAYNGASTVANVLFAEPTAGVFRIIDAIVHGGVMPWQIVYLWSSIATTTVIAWWAIGTARRSKGDGWSREARVAAALATALAASGALSFNYSRDRLGGMALVFYAIATYYAVRALVDRAGGLPRYARTVAGVALLLVAFAWQVRVVHTLEFARRRSANSYREWITDLHQRREQSATQPVYLRIMEELAPQGTAEGLARPTRYPEWLFGILGPF